MAKIFKISGYLVDPVGLYTSEYIKAFVENKLYSGWLLYRHLHIQGKIVEVLAISQDAEMPGQFIVVYIDKDNYVWHQPLGMFLSEVDHEKYPLVKQKYRFELVEEG